MKVESRILRDWRRFEELVELFPAYLDDPDKDWDTDEIARHLMAWCRSPCANPQDLARMYRARGEVKAFRTVIGGLAKQDRRLLQAEMEDTIEELSRRIDTLHREVFRAIEAVRGGPEGWKEAAAARMESAREMEKRERPGEALRMLETLRQDVTQRKEDAIRHVQLRAAQLREGMTTAEVLELVEAAEVFCNRGDLWSATEALTLASNAETATLPPEARHLAARARATVEERVVRKLPPALGRITGLRDIQGWFQDSREGTPTSTRVPDEFLRLWQPVRDQGELSDSRSGFLTNALVALLTDSQEKQNRRYVSVEAMLTRMEQLCDVVVQNKKRPRGLVGTELLYTTLRFKNAERGPQELQGRDIPLYIVLSQKPEALLASIENTQAAQRVTGSCIVLTPVPAPQMQARARRSTQSIAVVDALGMLRIALSNRPADAFLRETLQQLDLMTIQPYRDRAIATGYMFRGRMDELKRMRTRSGSFILYGARMMGKTSLLARVADDLRKTGWTDVFRSCEPLKNPAIDPLSLCEVLLEDLKHKKILVTRPQHFIDEIVTHLEANPEARIAFFIDEIDDFLDADEDMDFAVCNTFKTLAEGKYRDRIRFYFAGFKKLYAAAVVDSKPLTRFAESILIGPLDEKASTGLIEEPLELMGLDLEDGDGVQLRTFIQRYTSNHPSLMQKFCGLLVERIAARDEPPPHSVQREDVESVYKSSEYREHVLFTLRKNYEPVQELLVYLAVLELKERRKRGDENDVFTAEKLRDDLIYWAGSSGKRESNRSAWEEYLTVQRVRVLLDELKTLRVIDAAKSGGYRFALSVYPPIIEETTNLDGKILELAEELQSKPVFLSRATQKPDRRPTTLREFALILRDRDRHHVLVGMPGLGKSESLGQIQEAIQRSRNWKAIPISAAECVSFLDFMKAVAKELGIEGARKSVEKEIVRCTLPRDGIEQKMVLLIDNPTVLAIRQPEMDKLLDFAMQLRQETGQRFWMILAGEASTWRSFKSFAQRSDEANGVFVVNALKRFTREDCELSMLRKVGDVVRSWDVTDMNRIYSVTGGYPLIVDCLSQRLPREAASAGAVKKLVNQYDAELGQDGDCSRNLRSKIIEPMDPRQRLLLHVVAQRPDCTAESIVVEFLAGVDRPSDVLSGQVRAELDLLVEMDVVERTHDGYRMRETDPLVRLILLERLEPRLLVRSFSE